MQPPKYIPIHPHLHPPPTLCLCSELEWLVFHFGLPGALLHSLAWPVYHYWSLSLTWTNRGPFSKVVSQVAVTGVSGTVGLRVLTQAHWVSWKICWDASQTPSYTGRRLFDNKNPLFQGGCQGVLFLIKAGLMRPARMGTLYHPSNALYSIYSIWSNEPSIIHLKSFAHSLAFLNHQHPRQLIMV